MPTTTTYAPGTVGSRQRPVTITATIPTDPNRPKTTRQSGNSPQPLIYWDSTSNTCDMAAIHNTVRGHLIALKFGGEENRQNLVPMYGQFNNGGKWSAFEAELEKELNKAQGNTATVVVTCRYDDNVDPHVPSGFSVALSSQTGTLIRRWNIPHPAPMIIYERPREGFRDRILRYQEMMEEDGWFVEDHKFAVSRIPNDPLLVPPLRTKNDNPVWMDRPYAVLDYMTFKWNIFPKVKRDNTAAFTDYQIELISRVNRALNNGYTFSDDQEDYVYNTTNIPHPPGLATRPGILLPQGSHQAPQIDHIVPKALGGTNAYSNARVVSQWLNDKKKASADEKAHQQALANAQDRHSTRSTKGKISRYY